MTQDEIIEMARQAGLSVENPQWGYSERHHIAGWITNFEAFAKLVAKKEREACAEIAESKRHAPHFALRSMPSQNGTAVDIANLIKARWQA